MKPKLRDTITSYLFLAPFLTIFSIFLAYPVFYSFYLSMRKVTASTSLFNVFADMKFVGLKNYIYLLKDVDFWTSLLVTFYYAILYIPLLIAVSLLLAVLLNSQLKGHTFFRSTYFMPNVLDTFVVGTIWLLLYAPQYGLISRFIDLLGLKLLSDISSKGVLGHPQTSMLGIVLMLVLKNAGFGMILFLAAIQNIPQSVYEASDIDGANAWQKIKYITLPLVKPVILFMVITGTIGALNCFTEIYATTGGGPATTIYGRVIQLTRVSGFYLFQQWERMNYGYAAAIAYALLIITLLISFIYAKLLRQK